MSCLQYRQDELYIDHVNLAEVANQYGTPCYVYSREAIERAWQSFDNAFSSIRHRICYAVKANSNIAILQLLAQLGSGFDIVSGGELARVIAAGGNPANIVFSGVGKRRDEIEEGIKAGIYCFNVESEAELEHINLIADELSTQVRIGLRVNPDVDPQTHQHISTGQKHNKFGIDLHAVLPLCEKISNMPHIKLAGIAGHIGSQILILTPLLASVDKLINLYHELIAKGMPLEFINIGGGLGIHYRDEVAPSVVEYGNAIREKMHQLPIEIIIEPGRYIVGNAGVLLTRVEYLKHTHDKHFALVDAGMNDLVRPALYDAWQSILPVRRHDLDTKCYDIAGPVCESADFLGKDRDLSIKQGDVLAINSAGAYGFSMSSNYNSRCRVAEILVDHDKCHLIRRRETIKELFAAENTINYMLG